MEVKNAYIAVGKVQNEVLHFLRKNFKNFASILIYPENRKKLSLKAEFGIKSA